MESGSDGRVLCGFARGMVCRIGDVEGTVHVSDAKMSQGQIPRKGFECQQAFVSFIRQRPAKEWISFRFVEMVVTPLGAVDRADGDCV